MDLIPNTTWKPTVDRTGTFSRKLISVKRSGTNPAFDRVTFRRVLHDGSLGAEQSSYVSGWNAWVKKFKARVHDVSTAPPFPSVGGVQFYAKDGADRWHYVNHAGTWQACPPPFST